MLIQKNTHIVVMIFVFNNKGTDILILGKGPTQGLDDTTLTAET